MDNKYELGDIVNVADDNIINGIIISVEQVTSNPRLAPFQLLKDYMDSLDTFQYEIAFEFEGTVYKDTYYEHLID